MTATQRPACLNGHFLVAETELGDPNFSHTVVLMVAHDGDGAFGLVVNRKSEYTLGQAAPSYRDAVVGGIPLYVGGPVETEYLFCLHSGLPEGYGSEHSQPVVPGVVFEPNFKEVERAFLERAGTAGAELPQVRLFAGYSGWGPGQLEAELDEGAWVVLPASADLVFAPDPAEGWKEALRRKGGIWWAAAETGYKPSMN